MRSHNKKNVPFKKKFWNFLQANYLIILIVLVALIFRLWLVGAQSIWLDEAMTIHTVNKPVLESLELTEPTIPIYPFILSIWIHILGKSLFSTYLFSILAGAGVVLLIYILGKKLFSENVGLIAALFAAVNPTLIYYAQEIRVYILFFLIAVWSTLALVDVIKKPSKKNLLIYGFVALLLLFIHNYGVFVLLAQFIGWFIARKGRLKKDQLVLGGLLTLAYLPWLLKMFYFSATEHAIGIPPPTGILLFSLIQEVVNGKVMPIFWPLSIALLVMSCVFALLKNNWKEWTLIALILVPGLLPFFLSHITTPFFFVRYALVITPFVLLLSAKGSLAIPKRWGRIAFISLFVLLLLISTVVQQTTVLKDDWQSTVKGVQKWYPNTLTLIIPYYNTAPFLYYADKECFFKESYNESYKCAGLKGVYAIHPRNNFSLEPGDNFILILSQTPGEHTQVKERVFDAAVVQKMFESKIHTNKIIPEKIYKLLNLNNQYDVYSPIEVYEGIWIK